MTPLTNHSSAVLSLAFNDNGNFLASSAGDNVITIWDIIEKKLLITIPTFEVIYFILFYSRQLKGYP